MYGQETQKRWRMISRRLVWTLIAGLLFGLGISLATQRYLVSLITGLAMSCAIEAAFQLGEAILKPRLARLPYDWMRLGLEIMVLLLGHIGGAILALMACSRLFGFSVWDSRLWWAVVGMVVGFPIIHGTESALRAYRQLKEREQLAARLRGMAAQAELKALKAQINPHFFFNTLNTIAELIHTNPAQAEASVERLATMFRHILAVSERGQVPLSEELAFVDDYLAIEQARFGQRLQVTRTIDPQALSTPVPTLILQPLVENAVAHGSSNDGNLAIELRVALQAEVVEISVADQGPGMPAGYRIGSGPGHGLRNVDERLRKTYGRGLVVQANEPSGAVFIVRIPV